MGAFIDLTGKQFGQLTVTGRAPNRVTPGGQSKRYWTCTCACGSTLEVPAGNLPSGRARSCGCRRKAANGERRLDLTGQTFGELTVIGAAEDYSYPSTGTPRAAWACRCSCGDVVRVLTCNLKSGQSTTCGHLRPVVGYRAAHSRVERARGKASSHRCADCPGAAEHWSYDHSDPDEVQGPYQGTWKSYSMDVDRYEPRCVKCHRAFDAPFEAVRSAS